MEYQVRESGGIVKAERMLSCKVDARISLKHVSVRNNEKEDKVKTIGRTGGKKEQDWEANNKDTNDNIYFNTIHSKQWAPLAGVQKSEGNPVASVLINFGKLVLFSYVSHYNDLGVIIVLLLVQILPLLSHFLLCVSLV